MWNSNFQGLGISISLLSNKSLAQRLDQTEIWRILRPSQHLLLFIMFLKPFLNIFSMWQGTFSCWNRPMPLGNTIVMKGCTPSATMVKSSGTCLNRIHVPEPKVCSTVALLGDSTILHPPCEQINLGHSQPCCWFTVFLGRQWNEWYEPLHTTHKTCLFGGALAAIWPFPKSICLLIFFMLAYFLLFQHIYFKNWLFTCCPIQYQAIFWKANIMLSLLLAVVMPHFSAVLLV